MAMRQNMSARARSMRNPRRPRVNPAMRTRAMSAGRPRRPMGNRARMMRSQRGMM